MKLLALISLLVPLSSFARSMFVYDELHSAQLGQPVSRSSFQNCVKGSTSKVEFEVPEITYRVRIAKDSETTSRFVVELEYADRKSTLTKISAGSASSLTKANCGEEFVSAIFYGERLTYSYFIDVAEAATVTPFEIVETEEPMEKVFVARVQDAYSRLKTVHGFSVQIVGPHEVPTGTMAEAFDWFKAHALENSSTHFPLRADVVPYPKEIQRRIKN